MIRRLTEWWHRDDLTEEEAEEHRAKVMLVGWGLHGGALAVQVVCAAVLIVCAVAMCSSPARAQTPVTVVSLATESERDEWATIAFPQEDVPAGVHRGVMLPQGWEVAVGRKLGTHTTLVHVLGVQVKPGIRIDGLVNWRPTTAPPLGRVPDPWSTSKQLVPMPVLETTRGVVPITQLVQDIVYQDQVETITMFQCRFGGDAGELGAKVYLYQMSGSPVARWDFQLIHSDPRSSDLYKSITSLKIQSVRPHRVEWNTYLGASDPAATDTAWTTTLLGPERLADGVRPFWTGVSISLPDRLKGDDLLDEGKMRRIRTGIAGWEGPTVACVGRSVWDGHWLALGHVPAIPGNLGAWASGEEEWRRWKHDSRRAGGYWDLRSKGLHKQPGRTGDQPAFGVVRGGEIVSTGCPLPLDGFYVPRVTTHLRPVGYREADLSNVTRERHPNWRTWQGRTFKLDRPFDTLGKDIEVGQHVRPSTREWLAPDEQHYGHLSLCAWYALTGRLVARDLLQDLTEVWLVSYHEEPPGAARGMGRSWLDMATVALLTGDARIGEHMIQQAQRLQGWENNIPGPVKCWPRVNDVRALKDAAGNPVPAGNAWQIGLLIPGLEAAHRLTDDEVIGAWCQLNVQALIDAAWFRSQGRWNVVDYWAFRGGAMPDASYYGTDGNVTGLSHSTGWFYDWVAYATGKGASLNIGPADQIMRSRYGTVGRDWRAVQWR